MSTGEVTENKGQDVAESDNVHYDYRVLAADLSYD